MDYDDGGYGYGGGYGDASFQPDGQADEPYFTPRTDGPYAGWSNYALDNLKESLSPVDFGKFLQDRIGTFGANNINQDPDAPPSQCTLSYDPTDYGAPALSQPGNAGQANGWTDPDSIWGGTSGGLGYGGGQGYGGGFGSAGNPGYGDLGYGGAFGSAPTPPALDFSGPSFLSKLLGTGGGAGDSWLTGSAGQGDSQGDPWNQAGGYGGEQFGQASPFLNLGASEAWAGTRVIKNPDGSRTYVDDQTGQPLPPRVQPNPQKDVIGQQYAPVDWGQKIRDFFGGSSSASTAKTPDKNK
jgi:hypothetical protein